jgi:hypothetical protein
VRLLVSFAAMVLVGCAPVPAPVAQVKADATKDAWYAQTVAELSALHREAAILIQSGKADAGAELITKGQPLMTRLLSVERPTLAAMEAASDLDELYGRMLLANRHYGWARMLFQKNLARWRNWQPQTPETERRRKLAESGIAECDRGLL